jgi:3-dehydroquinate dehydratase / shikimate dehydrogenase
MTLVCVPLVAPTLEKMGADAVAAAAAGGDLVEIRLDFIQGFCPREHLPRLLRGCPLPALVTYRFDPSSNPAPRNQWFQQSPSPRIS